MARESDQSRRRFLKATGAVASVGMVAGCTGNQGGEDNNGDSTSSPQGGENDNGDSTGTSENTEEVQEQTFTVSNSLPKDHYISQNGIIKFADLVEEKTDGKITFNMHHGGTLGDRDSQTRLVQEGTADIANGLVNHESSKLPLSNVVGIPGAFLDGYHGCRSFDRLVREQLNELELNEKGMMGLNGWTAATYQLGFKNSKVTKLEQFEGMKCRTSGGLVDQAVENLGGVPVELPGPEAYSALERGTIEAVVWTIAAAPPYDLGNILKYMTSNINVAGIGGVFYMNMDVWGSISSSLQDVLLSAGQEASYSIGKANVEETETAKKTLEDKGTEIYKLDEEEWNNNWVPKLEPVQEQWVEQVDNPAAEDVLQAYRNILEEEPLYDEKF